MCGIIAAVAGRGAVSGDSLTRAVRRLDHRGPDGHRVWVAPNRRAGLGHARLSIIDLTTGDQPIPNEDGRLRIVVNGEFYDFERIRAELERRGHVSGPDRTARSRCTCSKTRARAPSTH